MGTKKIGVFDSGYGGLTVLNDIRKVLPEYDYIYLGDNARAPYGTRSFEVVYQFTLQAVKKLFALDCELVILACNTASAKALRTIQQQDLPLIAPDKRVLGVIRPTAEEIGKFTQSKIVGVLGTKGTVLSNSYAIEISKQYPDLTVIQHACPLWVPLIENNKHDSKGGRLIIKEDLESLMQINSNIDCVLLACTHYPILQSYLQELTSNQVRIIAQGEIVARSLKDYLARHKAMDLLLSKNGGIQYLTTERTDAFNQFVSSFLGELIESEQVRIDTL